MNYRPTSQFFPFSVFRFPRSFFCMNESMAIAEGQSTNQTGQATPDVHDEVYTGHNNQKKQHSQMMNNPNQPLTYMYCKSRLIFNSNEIPVCSTPCQLLNCIHPENENFSYSPAPPPGGGVTARYGPYKYVLL